jgi:omega-amidase
MAGDSEDRRARQKFEVKQNRLMKIAAAQISCVLGDFDANLQKIRDFASVAKKSGAELVVFPEMVDTGYSMPVIQTHARKWREGAVPELQKFAREFSIAIVAGISDRDGRSVFNAQVLVNAQGDIVAKYRKTHLVTAAPLDERICLSPGNELVSCKIRKFTVGLSICYDLRFPEMARTLVVKHGANVIVNSSAWPVVRAEHLRILALARAVENQSYFIITNRVGTDDGVTFCGSSLIVDPSGAILADASPDREEIICGQISNEVVDLVRSRVAVFQHRRPDLY